MNFNELRQLSRNGLAMLKTNRDYLLVLAGFGIFLPQILASWLGGIPMDMSAILGDAQTAEEAMAQLQKHFNNGSDLVIRFGLSLLADYAGLVMLLFLLDRGETLGSAMGKGLRLFPLYLVILLLLAIPVMLVLGILPGIWAAFILIAPLIYVLFRCSLSFAILATDNLRNPIGIIRRSWQISKGRLWHMVTIFLMTHIYAMLFMLVVTIVLSGLALIAGSNSSQDFFPALTSAMGGSVGKIAMMAYMAFAYQMVTSEMATSD